jgi:hypothetical protein
VTTCTHGMPSPLSCLDCMDDGNLPPAPRPEPETVSVDFTARFDSHCPECNLPIIKGTPIVKTTRGRYLHAGCAP